MHHAPDFATLLPLALPAHEQDHRKGLDAYNRGDYATAPREWRPLAEWNDGVAQGILGDLYPTGHGVPRDYTRMAKCYQPAAEQGDAGARTDLGVTLATGDVGPWKPLSTE